MRQLQIVALALLAVGAIAPAATLQLPIDPQAPTPSDTPAAPLAVRPILDEVPDAPASPVAWRAPRAPSLTPPAAAAAVTAGGAAIALVAFGLYSRLARSELLDHARRDEVYKLVQASPGISLTDVAQRCGLGWGTAVYHLDRMERAGFVASQRIGARRCYFPVGAMPKDERAKLGTLQQETTRTIAQFVSERPGATQTELAQALGLTASAASKQVSKLESAGLVRRERDWKTVRLHPEGRLGELLSVAPSRA